MYFLLFSHFLLYIDPSAMDATLHRKHLLTRQRPLATCGQLITLQGRKISELWQNLLHSKGGLMMVALPALQTGSLRPHPLDFSLVYSFNKGLCIPD